MAGNRKRKRPVHTAEECSRKRSRTGRGNGSGPRALPVAFNTPHPVLSFYYPSVVTLRAYLLSKLPVSSKIRRRRLASIGRCSEERCRYPPHRASKGHGQGSGVDCADTSFCASDGRDGSLARLLDATLVCGADEVAADKHQSRLRELAAFSQQQQRLTGASSYGTQNCSQSEVGGISSTSVSSSSSVTSS